MTSLTPEALRSLCEKLPAFGEFWKIIAPESGVDSTPIVEMLTEAAAAIAGLVENLAIARVRADFNDHERMRWQERTTQAEQEVKRLRRLLAGVQ